jgi:hypothetical protein
VPTLASRFPQLRELCLSGESTDALCRISVPQTGLAALRKLEILCGYRSHWLGIVQTVSATLVSLTLCFLCRPAYSECHFSFPQLRHLGITKRCDAVPMVLDLDAPRLESIEHGLGVGARDGILIRLRNPRTVKQLRTESYLLDLTPYPALRKLWINGNMYYNHKMLQSLKCQIISCPELEAIMYCDQPQRWEPMYGEYQYCPLGSAFTAIVDLVRETGRDITVREFLPTELDLPGAVQRSVSIPLTTILLLT